MNQAQRVIDASPPKILLTVGSQTDPENKVPLEVQLHNSVHADAAKKDQSTSPEMYAQPEQGCLLENSSQARKESEMRIERHNSEVETMAACRSIVDVLQASPSQSVHQVPLPLLDKSDSNQICNRLRAESRESKMGMAHRCSSSLGENGFKKQIEVPPKNCQRAMVYDKFVRGKGHNESVQNNCARERWQKLPLEVSCPFRPRKQDTRMHRRSFRASTTSGRGRREIKRVYARVPKASKQHRDSFGSLQKSRTKKKIVVHSTGIVKRAKKSNKSKQVTHKGSLPSNQDQKYLKTNKTPFLSPVQIKGKISTIFAEGSDCDTACQMSDSEMNREVQERLQLHQQKKARQAGLKCTQ